jgi:hypothetical protein
MKKTALTLLLITFSQPIFAQAMIDGTDINEILNIARGYGAATLEEAEDDDDNPAIRGRINGNPYFLSFRNCTSKTSCEDFYIQSYHIDPIVDYKLANEWNYENRWTKLYFDDDGDAVLEMDYNMDGGVSYNNAEQAFSIWKDYLDDFHNGYLKEKED